MDGKGKVALVTGSTSGIGLAIAIALAKRGCDVIVTGLEAAKDPAVDAIKSQISSFNVRVKYIPGDLSVLSDIERLCQESIKTFPQGVDILVNNAGFNVVHLVEDFPDDVWDSMVAVMLTAPFRLVKRLVPGMKTKGWGRIINICSQMATVSIPGKSVYSACKTGLVGFTQTFPQGVDILVNNAGFNVVHLVEDFPDDVWDSMVAVMLTAPFRLVKRLVSGMKTKGWGRIINICSQMATVSIPGKSVYSACKTGLVGFTRGVALEAAEFGVTCNAVSPTFAETALLRHEIDDNVKTLGISYEMAMKTFTDQVPTKKICTVEQIADLVVFMTLSEASSQINGVDYLIDGGYVAQ